MKKALFFLGKANRYWYYLLGIVIIFSIGIVFTVKETENTEKEIRQRMFVLTESFASLLDSQKFITLNENLADETVPDYVALKEKLVKLGQLNQVFGIRWIYAMVPKDGEIVFSVDSIPNNSPDYSPPGDLYSDASPDMIIGVNKAWNDKASYITSPYVDKWGHFITTIVPVVDNSTGKTVSVLAADMDYELFYQNKIRNVQMFSVSVTILFEIIFSFLFFFIANILKGKEDLLNKNIVLKQYVENVPGVFFQYQLFPDGRTKMPFTSKRMWDIFEVHREDLMKDGSKIFSHIKKEDIPELVASIEKSKETLEDWNHDFRVELSRGERWLRANSKPEKLSDGSVLWYGYVADITEHKEMEMEMKKKEELITQEIGDLEVANKKLKENRESILNLMTEMAKAKKGLEADDQKMKTIISSMGEGLFMLNRQYKIILVNPKGLELLGMEGDIVLGRNLHDIVKLMKGKKELPLESWPTEESFNEIKVVTTSLEDDIYIKTNEMANPKAVTLSISPLKEEKDGVTVNNNLVVVIRDANKDKELDIAKSGFISTASHQLRTPLTTIRWYSEMLLSGSYGVLSEAQHDLVNEIHGGVNRLYQTINLLLGISRIENGKIGHERVPIDLTAITAEVVKELTPSMMEKKLVYFSFSSQTDPIFVILDPVTLRQVVLNLFANAIRYTNNNGTIEGRWLIDKEKNEVIYSVRDNGIGIPKAAQSKIFTKFYRADNAILKSPDGTGLGLAFVKDIVNSWGGRVWYETEEGKGTTFYFTIPTYKV